ncbi:efflux RND transporter permease subunit, partial [Escherichia coli]|nr:efflux RND transporter permease subunit [Escherichia coli]
DRMTDRYGVRVSKLTKRIGRVMLMFALLVGMLVYSFGKLPSAFLPEEDQGYFITSFLLPSDATTERTSAVVKSFEEYVATRP